MLRKYRAQIDKIDSKIVKLLSQRVKVSLEVGKLKKDKGVKVVDMAREREVFDKVVKEGIKMGLGENYIKKVFKMIIRDSRRNQK
ncbi:chorismate mutase [archaeon]|jgi:chorismate mutase|nr:chorismate mutase [archaeon]